MVCDHIEIAEEGRTCEICSVLLDDGQLCSLCTRTMNELHNLQASPGYGDSLVHVLTSLQKWARDIPAWDLIQGVDVLMKPINQRYDRPEQHRIAPFVVLEGPDFSGKTFHAEAVSLWLTQQGFAVQTLTFPNNQTPLGGKFHKQPVPPRHSRFFPCGLLCPRRSNCLICRCTFALYCPNVVFSHGSWVVCAWTIWRFVMWLRKPCCT